MKVARKRPVMAGLLCQIWALFFWCTAAGLPPTQMAAHFPRSNGFCYPSISLPGQGVSGGTIRCASIGHIAAAAVGQGATLELRGGGEEDTGWGAWKALASPKVPAPPRDQTPPEESTPKRSTPARSLDRFSKTPTRQIYQDSVTNELPSAASAWSAARARADFSSGIEEGDVVVPGECKTLRQALQRVGSGRRVLLRSGVECRLSSGLAVKCRARYDAAGRRSVHICGGWGAGGSGQAGREKRDELSRERGAEMSAGEPAEHGSEGQEASVVWGAWVCEPGVSGTLHGLTLSLPSEAAQKKRTEDGVANILLDIQGGEWALKDVTLCPMRTCGVRVAHVGNVSMFNCLVRGIPPSDPAADGIVCINQATLALEGCTFQFVGIEVAVAEGGVFCGNLTAMMQRADEFEAQARASSATEDADDDEEEGRDDDVDGAIKTPGFRRFGMLDPGVVPGVTRGIGVSFFQRSSGTVMACRFLKCGIGIDVGDTAHASVISSHFHDTEFAFRADDECQEAALLSRGNRITGEGRSWFNERRPGRLREHNNECEQERKEEEEVEAMMREMKDLDEWHAPADLREPFLEHFGEGAKDFVDELIWDVSREETERQLGPKIKRELAEIEAKVRRDLEPRLPVFKEFSIFMPTLNGDPIPGDLGHLEVDPEEEIARALAAEEEEEGESSDGIGPMPSLDAP